MDIRLSRQKSSAPRRRRSSGWSPEIIRAGMTRLSEQERMVVDRVAGLEACYLPQFYEAEEYVCRRILQMTGELEAPSNLESLVDRAEQIQSLTYAAQQREAIRMAAQRQLLIVTGGPGTARRRSCPAFWRSMIR